MARKFHSDNLKQNDLIAGWKLQNAANKRRQQMMNINANISSEASSCSGAVQLKTGSLETIDRAMEIQQILYEFSQIINSYYRFQLLIVILTAFIIIVFDCYYLLEVLNNPHQRIAYTAYRQYI